MEYLARLEQSLYVHGRSITKVTGVARSGLSKGLMPAALKQSAGYYPGNEIRVLLSKIFHFTKNDKHAIFIHFRRISGVG
jgi:hypothetical protein